MDTTLALTTKYQLNEGEYLWVITQLTLHFSARQKKTFWTALQQ